MKKRQLHAVIVCYGKDAVRVAADLAPSGKAMTIYAGHLRWDMWSEERLAVATTIDMGAVVNGCLALTKSDAVPQHLVHLLLLPRAGIAEASSLASALAQDCVHGCQVIRGEAFGVYDLKRALQIARDYE